MDKRKEAKLYEYLGDVTPEEFDEYLEQAEKSVAAVIERCNILQLAELEIEYQTCVAASKSYYTHFLALVTLGTYKKLRPDEFQKDKKTIFFVAWMVEWVGVTWFLVNDFCDKNEKRAKQPTPYAQLGTANTMCLYLTILNVTYDLATEVLAQEPFLIPFLTFCRHRVNWFSLSCLIDTSCEKYDRRRDPKWLQVRSYSSTIYPAFVSPVEAAYLMAQESTESEVAKASLQLANLMGCYVRTVDDIFDLELDLIEGRMNWAFFAAFGKANEEQQSILLGWSSSSSSSSTKSKKTTPATLLKLYSDLGIQKEISDYKTSAKERFAKILDESPDEVPKAMWKGIFEGYAKFYSGAGTSSWQDQV